MGNPSVRKSICGAHWTYRVHISGSAQSFVQGEFTKQCGLKPQQPEGSANDRETKRKAEEWVNLSVKRPWGPDNKITLG